MALTLIEKGRADSSFILEKTCFSGGKGFFWRGEGYKRIFSKSAELNR